MAAAHKSVEDLKRRNIAVKLTDEELKDVKRMAIDRDTTAVQIITDLIKRELRAHSSHRR